MNAADSLNHNTSDSQKTRSQNQPPQTQPSQLTVHQTLPLPSSPSPSTPPSGQTLLQELWGKKLYILKSFALLSLYWLVQFAMQYYWLAPGDLNTSLVRSFSLGGATLIAIALMFGPLAVLIPKCNFIEYRRTVGVSGFTLIIMHVLSVLNWVNFRLSELYWSLNPFVNPIVFGSMAFFLLWFLFLTSTDWAVRKLSFKNWKTVHRIVYVAFVLAILHFALINPPVLQTPPAQLLIIATIAALLLQAAAFAKRIKSKPQLSLAAWVGIAVILFALIMFALAFFFRDLVS